MPRSFETTVDLFASELAEQAQKRTELRRLLWRFITSIALIAATVGVATVAARWTGRPG